MYKKIFTLSLIFILILSCGKPNDAEDYTGGYKIVKKFATVGYANDLLVEGNLCYVTMGELGLSAIDITDPKNPSLISFLSEGTRGYSTRISKKENAVYIAAGGFGVTVVDVQDPANMLVSFSNINIKPCKDVFVFGDYLVSSIGEHGFNMTNIEVPLNPSIRATNGTNGYTQSLVVTNDNNTLLAATGEFGLSVFDISTFEEGYGIYPKIGSLNLSGYASGIQIDDSNSIAYVACGSEGLQIVDYSDPSNLRLLGTLQTGGYANDLFFENNKVYLTTRSAGLQIIDVADNNNPKLIGTIDSSHADGVSVKGNFILVADEDEGLIVIEKP